MKGQGALIPQPSSVIHPSSLLTAMVLLLGATTYIGRAFAKALRRRHDPFIPLSQSAFDYTRFDFLFDYVRKVRPDLLINADEVSAGIDGCSDHNEPAHDGELERWSGMENGALEKWSRSLLGTQNAAGASSLKNNDSIAKHSSTPPLHHPIQSSERMEMLQINTLLPQTIARVCEATNTPWGHVSSGSIYSGAKIIGNGTIRTEGDLASPATCELFAAHPERFRGFNETDEPNFSFKSAPCTFYSGTKALAEEALRGSGNYVWRLRLPFSEQDGPGNFLSQLQDGAALHDAINSLSQLDECVSACLELWDRRAAFGIYNIVNPGAVRTNDVLQMIQRVLKPARRFQLMVYQGNGNNGEKAPYSNCILDGSKLLKAGVKLRPINEAIEKALHSWQLGTARAERTMA